MKQYYNGSERALHSSLTALEQLCVLAQANTPNSHKIHHVPSKNWIANKHRLTYPRKEKKEKRKTHTHTQILIYGDPLPECREYSYFQIKYKMISVIENGRLFKLKVNMLGCLFTYFIKYFSNPKLYLCYIHILDKTNSRIILRKDLLKVIFISSRCLK